jgi:hypothetical protein
MKFSILRHNSGYSTRDIPGSWTVIVDGAERRVLSELCFDEMLGAAARLLLGSYQPWRLWNSSLWTFEPKPVEWQVDIDQCDDAPPWSGAHWCIYRGDEFSGELTSDETLGFLAIYCLSDGRRGLFGGLKTYQQTIAGSPWLRDRQVVALLEHVA